VAGCVAGAYHRARGSGGGQGGASRSCAGDRDRPGAVRLGAAEKAAAAKR